MNQMKTGRFTWMPQPLAAVDIIIPILLVLAQSSVTSSNSLSQLKKPRHHRDFFVDSGTSTDQVLPTASLPSNLSIHFEENPDPCLGKFCGRGYECRLDEESNLPVCQCVRKCKKHNRIICGSDGKLYHSYCELHREECLRGSEAVPITVDHSYGCLKNAGNVPSNGVPEQGKPQKVPTRSRGHHHGSNNAISGRQNSDPETVDEAKLSPRRPSGETSKSSAASEIQSAQFQYFTELRPTASMSVGSRNEIPSDSHNNYFSYHEGSTPLGYTGGGNSSEDLLQTCTLQEYEIMKDNLLLFNHARLMAQNNKRSSSTTSEKEYLISIMFSHYDNNNNGALDSEELQQVTLRENLNQLSKGCTLSDMLKFDDNDLDGKLNINEFYLSFSRLYSVSVVSLDKALEVNHLSARVGDNVEIKCDVTGTPTPPIVWSRQNVDLTTLNEEEVKVFSDGSFYLTNIQLIHAGNYTCHAQRNRDVLQVHILTVYTIPKVHVTPRIQTKSPTDDAKIMCRVIGEPFPSVNWLKNDEPIFETYKKPVHSTSGALKYLMTGNGTSLVIGDITYSDTGAYMCQASNIGGVSRDISSLLVQEGPPPASPAQDEMNFFVFHDSGISVYEPNSCSLHHQIQGTDIIPGTQDYICGDRGVKCSWGRAVNVVDRYIYASQPTLDRVIVISTSQMLVIDVVATDKYPVDLYYLKHLDQIWVVNWRSEDGNQGVKTIQVIRNASEKRKHHSVHLDPIDGQFDLVSNLFLPSEQDLNHLFRYGYVTHTNQRGLFKLDLKHLRYVKNVDLMPYNCVPDSLQFSSLYGLIIIECKEPVTNRPTGQLVMDYLSDSVLNHKPKLFGHPIISPDSRIVVTVDKLSGGGGVTLVVQKTTGDGLRFLFDVKTSLNISDVIFFPSSTNHGYNLHASSTDKDDVLCLDLETGKVDIITAVGRPLSLSSVEWNNPVRPIASSGMFGQFLLTTAEHAVYVINGQRQTVNCEISIGMTHPRLIVWSERKS